MSAGAATATRQNARELALVVVRDVFGPEARGAQAAFDVRARRSGVDARDRAFAAELAYGAIKGRRLLDWYLAPYLDGRGRTLPPAILEILRLGVYQLRFMAGVEDHAAVFETVNLALRHGHKGTAGLVNAVLRRFIADSPAVPDPSDFEREADYLGTAYSVPSWIAAAWSEQFDGACRAVLAGINAPAQRAVRVNTLRAEVADVARILEERGAKVRVSPFVPETLIVEGDAIADDPGERWLVQGESACLPVDLLDPKPGETVLDLCSGRGHKSAQIAARMRGEGSLVCVESEPRKARALGATLERAGVTNAAIVEGDARDAAAELRADAVLLDAPCSSLGVLGRHPEARWRKSPGDAARLAGLQHGLLRAAVARTKPGARLAYSVCTTDPREGPLQIEEFLSAEPAFRRAALPERYAEFRTASGDVAVAPGIAGRDGFFVALLVREP
jgi:16S rRNA (cytosine967-C5)-methyltransferase